MPPLSALDRKIDDAVRAFVTDELEPAVKDVEEQVQSVTRDMEALERRVEKRLDEVGE